MNNDIFFSVMICCYNSEKYISETIDSIIKQTYKNWEIVVVNDGSTDNTDKILNTYIDDGIPIIYEYQKNKGFANARNKAIKLSNYDWIAIIDHDDICLSNRLEIQAKDIKENIDCSLFFGNSIHFLDGGKEVKRQFDYINPINFDLTVGNNTKMLLKHGCFIDSETVVFKKSDAESVGKFNENYKYITDYDFFLKLSEKYNFFCNPNVLSKWRIHDKQATIKMKHVSYLEHINLYKKNIYNQKHILIKINLFIKLIRIFVKKLIKQI